MSGWAWLGVALLGWIALSATTGLLVGRALRQVGTANHVRLKDVRAIVFRGSARAGRRRRTA